MCNRRDASRWAGIATAMPATADQESLAAALPSERYLALLEQLRDEGLQQKEIGELVGIKQSDVSNVLARRRGPGLEWIARAIHRLRLHPRFFFDAELASPSYHDHQPESADAASAWTRFEARYGPSFLGATTEQIAYLRTAPFRGGATEIAYARLLEALLSSELPEIAGGREAAAKVAAKASRGEVDARAPELVSGPRAPVRRPAR